MSVASVSGTVKIVDRRRQRGRSLVFESGGQEEESPLLLVFPGCDSIISFHLIKLPKQVSHSSAVL